MILDLEEMEDYPSNKIEGFYERLKTLLPSLYSHRCSEGRPGGFFHRVKEGTWMGHVIEHIGLEIQTLAGMDTGFGRTRGFGEHGVYNVVFSYIEEDVGRYAAKTSVDICQALIDGKDFDLEPHLQRMREIRERERLGPTTQSIISEAESRGIPWIRLNKYSLCQLGYGENQKRIQAAVTSETSSIGVELAGDKEDTKDILEQAEIPVPRGEIIRSLEELEEACEHIGFPLVIKPIDGNHGRGITTDIQSLEEAKIAFKSAQNVSYRVIVEKYIHGEDYRLLVINYRFVAAAKRTPAHVVGDGKSTIKELVAAVNSDPRRGYGHEKVLTKIEIDALSQSLIKEKGYTKDSVLPDKEVLRLKDTGNLSTGGTAEDVTDIVHPANVAMAERISRIIDLDICGIDVMTTDITKPLEKTGGSILEVNAGPGFRMHLSPTHGLPRNVAAPVVDKLFPTHGGTGRIPLVAVTGTNGKTTTTRLIAHMAKMHGCRVGYTTSDGVYIQNRLLMKGDCTGPVSAKFVLRDPTINFAVLECARGGLLRAGLAFQNCEMGIVTNVSGDHLGINGINTLDQLARVKSIIPEAVLPSGYAILNADDDLVYEMRKNLDCNIALFSMNEDNPRIRALQKLGGITAIYENGYITLCRGVWKMRILKGTAIPLTMGGKAKFMIQNILPAIIAANVQGISIEDMKAALESFIPSPSQTPGRMNFFNFQKFDFLLDFAHNPAGLMALKSFTENLKNPYKIGIVGGVGDRREEDTIQMGEIAGQMFDEIIIRQDQNLRGKSAEEINNLVKKGIAKVDPTKKITVITTERKALEFALNEVQEGGLVVLCSDTIPESLSFLTEMKEREDAKATESA